MTDAAAPAPATTPRDPIPVLCHSCRAEGMAGDSAFSAIPDILNFQPVARRLHTNGFSTKPLSWSELYSALTAAGYA